MARTIIAVAMQKGGVGKTSVAVNLAAAMAGHLQRRTYLMDFDGQCNATKAVLGEIPRHGPSLVSVMRDEMDLAEAGVVSPHDERLIVVPGSKEFARLEVEITRAGRWDVAARELPRLLRESLPEDAEMVVLDTPPSLGLWLQVALGMADEVLIVARPEEFSIDGIEDLVETVDHVRRHINGSLKIRAVLLNNVRAGTNEHAAFVQSFREVFADQVLQPHLPERIVIPQSQRDAVPLEYYGDPSAREVRGFFRQLARGLAQRAPGTAVGGAA